VLFRSGAPMTSAPQVAPAEPKPSAPLSPSIAPQPAVIESVPAAPKPSVPDVVPVAAKPGVFPAKLKRAARPISPVADPLATAAPKPKPHSELREQVDALIAQFPKVFDDTRPVTAADASDDMGHFCLRIDLRPGAPPKFAHRRLKPELESRVRECVDDLIRRGILRRSRSSYATPIHVVIKPDGSVRIVGDYRLLNTLTIPDKYPLRNISDMFDKLRGKCIFSKFDAKDGFFQIPVHVDDIHKTAVTTPFGLFEYTRMPFGLINAPSTFQRFMDTVLESLRNVHCYVDDILVASPDAATHLADLTSLFHRLDGWDIRLSRKKNQLVETQVEFLGHVINSQGIQPPLRKVQAIAEFARP